MACGGGSRPPSPSWMILRDPWAAAALHFGDWFSETRSMGVWDSERLI